MSILTPEMSPEQAYNTTLEIYLEKFTFEENPFLGRGNQQRSKMLGDNTRIRMIQDNNNESLSVGYLENGSNDFQQDLELMYYTLTKEGLYDLYVRPRRLQIGNFISDKLKPLPSANVIEPKFEVYFLLEESPDFKAAAGLLTVHLAEVIANNRYLEPPIKITV